MAIRRILVPTDFSEPSTQALELALKLGAPLRAEILLLHVVDAADVADTPAAMGLVGAPYLELLAEIEEKARLKLESLVTRLRRRRIGAHALVQKGKPPGTIVATAERLHADLIVMGTRGRTGLSHLVLGSVAEKVVRLSSCPVTTVGTRKPKPRIRRPRGAGTAAAQQEAPSADTLIQQLSRARSAQHPR